MAEIVGKSVLVIIRLKELAGLKRYDLMSSFQTKSFHELLWPRLGYRIQRQALKRKALVCTIEYECLTTRTYYTTFSLVNITS